MNLDHLRIFLAVAERLHVTRAAKDLNITQSGASAAVSALERRYCVKLFHRIGRSIALTDEGEVFVEHGRQLLAKVDEVELALSELSDLRRGSLSLHASHCIANYKLAPLLANYRRTYPDISISLRIGNDDQILDSVMNGDSSIGFVETSPDEDMFENIPIGENPLSIVYAPARLPISEKPNLEELARLPWIIREEGSSTRQMLFRTLSLNGIDPDRINIALEFPSHEAVRAAVEAGAGVAMLPTVVVEGALAQGGMTEAQVKLYPKRLFAIRRRDRHTSRPEAMMLETIRRELGVQVDTRSAS
jgi:DNA-binding transcriptional LysR family regulator